MSIDVVDLRNFYAHRLGTVARHFIGRGIRKRWIDLHGPTAAEVGAAQALGIEVPTLEDMEEIEISNRLYREDGTDYMTVVLPGRNEVDQQVANAMGSVRLAVDALRTGRYVVEVVLAQRTQRLMFVKQ